MKLINLVLILLFAKATIGQQYNLNSKLVPFDRTNGDVFGSQMATNGDYLVVTSRSPFDENGLDSVYSAGGVYIYKREVTGWNFHSKLIDPDRTPSSNSRFFGRSIDIFDSVCVVGVNNESYDENGLNFIASSGAVYIYKLNQSGNWEFFQKIVANDREDGSGYGWQVNIKDDKIIVACPYNDTDLNGVETGTLTNSGAIYVYQKSGDYYFQTQKIKPTISRAFQWFGERMCFSGNTIAVHARGEEFDENELNEITWAGAVYTFEDDGTGAFIQSDKLCASLRQASGVFGRTMAIWNNTLVIGFDQDSYDENDLNYIEQTGSVSVYEKQGDNTFIRTQKIVAFDRNLGMGEEFGSSVDVYNGKIVVGAENEYHDENDLNPIPYVGSVYLYEHGTSWQHSQKIIPTYREQYLQFGNDVSLNQSGDLFIAAHNDDFDQNQLNQKTEAGAVYFYKNCSSPTATINTTSISACGNEDISMTCSASPSTVTYQWQMNDGAGFIDLQNTLPFNNVTDGTLIIQGTLFDISDMDGNTFRCIATDGSCSTISDTVTLTVFQTPNVNGGNDNFLCEGDPATLFGSGAQSYTWNNGVTNGISFTPPVGQSSYIVIGTDANNCSNSDTVYLTVYAAPSFDLGNDFQLCEGNDSILEGPSGMQSYYWSTVHFDQNLLVNSSNTVSGMNQIWLTATDLIGCQYTDTINIEVLPVPVIDGGQDMVVCEGEGVTLSGSGGSSYAWDNGVIDGQSFIPSIGSTNYVVVGTSLNSCSQSDTVNVLVNAGPNFSLGSDIVLCENNLTDLLGPNSMISYQWSTGGANQLEVFDNSNLSIGLNSIALQVEDVNNCIGSDTLIIDFVSLPTVNLGMDTIICETQSLILSAPSGMMNYYWSTGGISNEEIVDNNNLVQGVNLVTVQVTDNNGCMNSDSIHVTLDPCLGLYEGELENIVVYPNPTKDQITIVLDLQDYQTIIYDVHGRKLKEGNSTSIIDLSDLTGGIYYLFIGNGSFQRTIRIEKLD